MRPRIRVVVVALVAAVLTMAQGLHMPNGVVFHDGALYVAEVNRILRYDNIEAHLTDPPPPVVLTDTYPRDTHHGWKFIRLGPDGLLYVPVGAPCNICQRPDPTLTPARYMNGRMVDKIMTCGILAERACM